jgi:DNA helicase-2/ATP-dependent DNA helicase PcrA
VPAIEESTAQRAAITHPYGPLLILAAAGTGKTHALVERFAWLTERGTAADAILVLTYSGDQADDLRERIEGRVPARYEELSVTTFQGFCARLLREEAIEAGVDPFAAPVTASDRLAMLLERIDELPLASHDLRGNPSALLGSIVQRIDRLKDELVTAERYQAWAAELPEATEGERVRAAREREFAAIYAAHDRMLAEAGALDFGDLALNALALLCAKPHVCARVASRFRHVLVDEFQDAAYVPARPPARSRSGAARPSAPRRRRSQPTSSGCSPARTSRRPTSASSCARSRPRARPSRSRSRSEPCPTGSPAPRRSSSAPRFATCSPGCGC